MSGEVYDAPRQRRSLDLRLAEEARLRDAWPEWLRRTRGVAGDGGSRFGALLREVRVACGMSVRDAAELFGVTPERYGAVERGVAPAPPEADR